MQKHIITNIIKRFFFLFFLFSFFPVPSTAGIENIFLSNKDTLNIVVNIGLAKKFYSTESPDYDSALIYLNKALKISTDYSNEFYVYKIYDSFAGMLSKTGNNPLAIDYYFKMMNMLDEKHTDNNNDIKYEYVNLYRRIAICMIQIDEQKALEYFNKSLGILNQIYSNDPSYPDIDRIRLLLYNNIGAALMDVDSGNFDQAYTYFEKALQYADSFDNPLYKASIYNNLGIIKWEWKEYDQSFDYYRRSLDIYNELGEKGRAAGIYYNFGYCNYTQNKLDKAVDELKLALQLGEESDHIKVQMLSASTLSKIYEKQKKYAEANKMLHMFHMLKDSVAGSDKVNNIAKIELQYLFEKQLKENEYKQQILISEREQRILGILLLSLFLLSLLIFSLLLYRNLRIKNKKNLLEQENLALQNENLELKNHQLEQSLVEKNEELNSHLKYLLKKKEFVASVIEDVSEIREEDPKQIITAMNDIKSNIESSVWNEFNVLFQNLHQDFYTQLYQKHTDLTSNEMRLCAFIRLNMSTKEIASVSLQSVKSVEVARTRLRKKLRLTRDINLNFYLSQF